VTPRVTDVLGLTVTHVPGQKCHACPCLHRRGSKPDTWLTSPSG
jgi:hypothetical protein